jgi:hypothetical protein
MAFLDGPYNILDVDIDQEKWVEEHFEALLAYLFAVSTNWFVGVVYCAFHQIGMVYNAANKAGFPEQQQMVLHKPKQVPLGGGKYTYNFENAIVLFKNKRNGSFNTDDSFPPLACVPVETEPTFTHDGVSNRAQKSVEFEMKMMRRFTSLQGTVLAPCSGSGTTMMAASQLGLNVLACDKDMQQCQLAHARLCQKEAERHKADAAAASKSSSTTSTSTSGSRRKRKAVYTVEQNNTADPSQPLCVSCLIPGGVLAQCEDCDELTHNHGKPDREQWCCVSCHNSRFPDDQIKV